MYITMEQPGEGARRVPVDGPVDPPMSDWRQFDASQLRQRSRDSLQTVIDSITRLKAPTRLS